MTVKRRTDLLKTVSLCADIQSGTIKSKPLSFVLAASTIDQFSPILRSSEYKGNLKYSKADFATCL